MAIEVSGGSIAPPEDVEHRSAAEETRDASIDQLIEHWWQDHFPGSAVARDTQAWNVAHAAKEMLKRLLKREYLTCN
jgi:hypothetical protein